MLRTGWCAAHRENTLDAGIEQAFAEHTLADHAGGTKKNDVHDVYRMHDAMVLARTNLFWKRNSCVRGNVVIEVSGRFDGVDLGAR